MRRRRAMTPPAAVPHTLDLPVDPQLVHDLAESLRAGVGDERAQFVRFVQATRLHALEDEAGPFAQRIHEDMTAAWPVWPAFIRPSEHHGCRARPRARSRAFAARGRPRPAIPISISRGIHPGDSRGISNDERGFC